MAKHIVYCADGTWNNPSQDKNDDHAADTTNVYKLFVCLQGDPSVESLRAADEQEKFLSENGTTLLAAKYIHGVGDSRNIMVKLLGGAFGAGVISRVVRGYTFISRNYEPGDHIHIVGFSRGAYTARALGGLIASQGVLTKPLTADKELAYRKGSQAWYRYRKNSKSPSVLASLGEATADLPAFLSRDSLRDQDLIPVERIASVCVWDTVGAMGIPRFGGDLARVDAYQFADTQLSTKVAHGFHALALDEERHDFMPTLWDAAGNVTQMLFPGAHSDVGGGYPAAKGECGLSDGALKWMTARMTEIGVPFADAPGIAFNPDPAGVAHKPWLYFPFNVPTVFKGRRNFRPDIAVDASVRQRMAAGNVVAEPGEAPAPYQPTNLP